MPNIKSAKKRAKQSEVRRERNLARKTAIKTAIKKVTASLEKKEDPALIKTLLKDVEGQFARAKCKGVIHKNTARRKVSKLAKKVASATRVQK